MAAIKMEMRQKRTMKTIVALKIRRSTPRRVLKTVLVPMPPKALPSPALLAWSRTKTMTATQRTI
jgi:hypothetical protein